MKRIAAGIAAIAATVVLVGCDTTTTGAAEGAPTTQTATTTAPTTAHTPEPAPVPMTADDIYLTVLDSNNIQYSTEATAIEVAHMVCDAFDSGITFNQLGTALLTANLPYTPKELGTILGASTGAYCPEHSGIADGVA